jgi:dipeptidyl-peptidase 4
MRRLLRWTVTCALLACGASEVAAQAADQAMGRTERAGAAQATGEAGEPVARTPYRPDSVDYSRAERFLRFHVSRSVVGDEVRPNWLPDGNQFWYRVTRPAGAEFVLVDPVRDEWRPVFDHARLAAALSVALDTPFDPVRLPFTSFDFGATEREIHVVARDRFLRCELDGYVCDEREPPVSVPGGHVVSPDSAWEAFHHEHDIWIRPFGGGDSIRITTDGEEFRAYGLTAPRPSELQGGARTPALRWSPDRRTIAVMRVDERDIEHLMIYSSTPQRPQAFTYPYPLPGDSIIPRPVVHLLDVETRANRPVLLEPEPAFLDFAGVMDSTWTADSERVRLLAYTRGRQHAQLVEVERTTGDWTSLASDATSTFIDLNHRGPANWWAGVPGDDVLWFSQRDGWGHIYRYGRDGRLKNQVTHGPFLVHTIHRVDAARQRIWFTAWGREPGRNPHHSHLYSVGFDGSGLRLLTPEDANHEISISPSGRFIVDTYSRQDSPQVTVLRAAEDGRVLRELERADISALTEMGWTPPEIITVKGRDGVTDIWGAIFKPSYFDPSRKYPVINHVYPGPQSGGVRHWNFAAGRRQDPHALAELGFLVVQFDHMGSPMRSKAFHDNYYGRMEDHGLPDHIAGLRQLAAERGYLDLDRVGIFGHSGGGFTSTAGILQYPDFFHVAVSRAGNHDNASYWFSWSEKYHGLMVRDTLRGTDSYQSQANARLAGNLRGKLLLIHGDMDDTVHPALTYRVVDALIRENKDFDLLILPDRFHGLNDPYAIRRGWDYFVTHLMGSTPPQEYQIRVPEG